MLNFGARGLVAANSARARRWMCFALCRPGNDGHCSRMQNLLAADTRQDFRPQYAGADRAQRQPDQLGQLADLQQSSVERVANGNPVSVPQGRYSRRR